jgi:hypothetical protein
MVETALSQINVAFETMRDGGNAPNASYCEKQLPNAPSSRGCARCPLWSGICPSVSPRS